MIPAACNFKNNGQEIYMFVSGLWFCHLHVISLLTLSSIAIIGRVIGKIKLNELGCRDKAPLRRVRVWRPRCHTPHLLSLQGHRLTERSLKRTVLLLFDIFKWSHHISQNHKDVKQTLTMQQQQQQTSAAVTTPISHELRSFRPKSVC